MRRSSVLSSDMSSVDEPSVGDEPGGGSDAASADQVASPGTLAARYFATTSEAAPSATRRPPSIQHTLVHSFVMAPMLWETKTTVLPSLAMSFSLPRHFAWKLASPTARTSSTNRISGSRWAATAKARRMYIPLE